MPKQFPSTQQLFCYLQCNHKALVKLWHTASKIAGFSSGEFFGLVADIPNAKIKLKIINAEIIKDTEKKNAEIASYKNIPVVKKIT